MAEQTKILTRELTASVQKTTTGGTTSTETLKGNVGTLALGKPGDIVERAYGPVVRTYVMTADATFGTYVAGKGILVNANEVAGISAVAATPFDTKTIKAGQVGSFLVSGACVVEKQQVAAIAAAMKVQYLGPDYANTAAATDVFIIEVNGFDNDTVKSSTL